MKLKIQARAKINWTLDVVGTLPNGYHDLDMLMQSVTLCDQMTMEEAPQLSLYVRAQGRAFVPADGNNLVLKAAAALQAATGCTRGARITLKKYIPVAAGMGGGSSDAAAALVGLTGREREIAALIAARLTNGEIARRLFLSDGSVKQYVHQIYAKLGLTGDAKSKRQQLIAQWHAKP